MKLKYAMLGLMAVFYAVLCSCTAPIDISTRDGDSVIAIYGCLTDENKHQYVRITGSSPYFDDKENRNVADANVRVKDSDGNEYAMEYGQKGYYISPVRFAARPGVTYRLTVEVDFNGDGKMEIYEAETTIPPPLALDSVDVRPLTIMGYRHFSLNIYAQDPPDADNYYLFKFFINDSISNDKISKYILTDDGFFKGEYLNGINIYYFEDITDAKVVEKNKDNDEAYMVFPGDKIRLQTMNIEKGYFWFINQCMSEMRGENPMFGGPPSNITTNITNGAVGYFTGYCIHEIRTEVP
ncbi:MAG: DUF4249 domain-containing protein [Tannerella sp.]|jgi:hypothetical protein|nr:DUF4249 domain-containing protein [Tannerella sp.]